MEQRKFMDAGSSYLIVDPNTAQYSGDIETLVDHVHKMFVSLFRKEPEQCFWCYGYEIACAGPIPKDCRNF